MQDPPIQCKFGVRVINERLTIIKLFFLLVQQIPKMGEHTIIVDDLHSNFQLMQDISYTVFLSLVKILISGMYFRRATNSNQ